MRQGGQQEAALGKGDRKMTYETTTMTHAQAHEFCRRFDLEIGTERELNTINGWYYIFCSDMESQGEINACRRFETFVLKIL